MSSAGAALTPPTTRICTRSLTPRRIPGNQRPRFRPHEAAERRSTIYAGGECKGGNTFSENEGYDPKTNRWLTLAPLPMGRHAFGAAAVGQYAYFIGGALGCGGGSPSDQMAIFSLP